VQITGRLKDMFIVGGFNVYPAEVEAAIREHESVRDVSLVGIPDERLGEVGAAFIVCEPGHELDPACSMLANCRGLLNARFQEPELPADGTRGETWPSGQNLARTASATSSGLRSTSASP
jgi:acyl-CoA synthetase (AMP-forming)/AMP-acid ligase II